MKQIRILFALVAVAGLAALLVPVAPASAFDPIGEAKKAACKKGCETAEDKCVKECKGDTKDACKTGCKESSKKCEKKC